MAIIDALPGIEVYVQVEKGRATEYDDPELLRHDENSIPRITTYIESINDARFSIISRVDENYIWQPTGYSLLFTIRVDGRVALGKFIDETSVTTGSNTREVDGCLVTDAQTGQLLCYPFKFSVLTTTDDTSKERLDKDLKIAASLGTIEVQVSRVKKTQRSGKYIWKKPVASEDPLVEKALKGKEISHRVSHGTAKPARRTPFWDCQVLPEDNGNPVAIFQFKYLSKESLRRELVIPSSPPPLSSAHNLPLGEIMRLAQERLDQIKTEEPPEPGPRLESRHSCKKVIDLTQDGDDDDDDRDSF